MVKSAYRKSCPYLFAICFLTILIPDSTIAQDVNEKLLRASEIGSLPEVQASISQGADLKTSDNFGKTALIMAAERGHTQVVSLLLKIKRMSMQRQETIQLH